MRIVLVLLFASLMACAKESPADSGAPPADDTAGATEVPAEPGDPSSYEDQDDDGAPTAPNREVWLAAPDFFDCRPLDAQSFPGAPELFDGIDNDCNGQSDDGCAPELSPGDPC